MNLEYRAARQTWKGWANFFKMIVRIRACAVREVAPLIQPYTKNKLWEPARQPQQLRSVSISIKFVHPFWVFCCFTHFGGSSSCFNFDENHGAAPTAVTNRWVPSRFCSLLCWQSLLFSSWGRCSLNFWASQSCSLLSNCFFFFFLFFFFKVRASFYW